MSVKMSCTGCRTSIVQTRSPRRTIIPRKPGAVDARTPIFAFGAAECRSRRIANGQAAPPSAGGAARDGLAYRYDSVSRSAGYDGRSPRRPGARARSPRGSRPDPSRNRGGVAIANRHRDRGPGNPARRTIGHRSARSNHPGQTRWKSYRRSRPRIPGSQQAPTAAVICCLFGSGRSIGYAVNSQSRCNMPSTSIFSCSPPWLVRSPWCFPQIADARLRIAPGQ